MLVQGKDSTHIVEGGDEVEMCDAEILDVLTTNRGELKIRTRSFNEDGHGQV